MNGKIKNNRGGYDNIDMVEPIHVERTKLVSDMVSEAVVQQEILREFKTTSMQQVDAFVRHSAEKHEVHLGGKIGNITLTSHCETMKVQFQVQKNIVFDEQIEAAKALFLEVATDAAVDSPPLAQAIINSNFETNNEGQLSTSRILDVCRWQIDDERWQRGKRAAYASMNTQSTSTFIRFYHREDSSKKWQAISLDIAKL